VKVDRVMERVYDRRRLYQAWHTVRRHAGAAGIDQMTVADFAQREEELLDLIQAKLQAGTYRFKPARRVQIPKPGSTKKRNLGIPVVMDRIVSHSLHSVLEELFEPDFTTSNFGFRRGKSQHQAIGHVRQAVVEGYEWCAAIDLQGFFDEIPHGLILKLIRRKIRDERVVTLIARALKAGVRVDGIVEKTVKGCPQGSPVSPMLSNIVLNELDHELEGRGHRYGRWADDFYHPAENGAGRSAGDGERDELSRTEPGAAGESGQKSSGSRQRRRVPRLPDSPRPDSDQYPGPKALQGPSAAVDAAQQWPVDVPDHPRPE
jgi:RNA-directed DNA polymerase